MAIEKGDGGCQHRLVGIIINDNGEYEARCTQCFKAIPFFFYTVEEWEAHKKAVRESKKGTKW